MPKKYISIQDASELSKKSIQTIRRAIKAKKLQCRRKKTPQGFNYLIDHESLCHFYNIKIAPDLKASAGIKPENSKKTVSKKSEEMGISADDFKNFTGTLERMLSQHSEERQNFLRLVNTLQEKIFVLENQLNLLKSPTKKWYTFWK
ncbi:MAG: hypothetical protein ABIH78_03700 [Candidatus Peregrinibacteria bacterium]